MTETTPLRIARSLRVRELVNSAFVLGLRAVYDANYRDWEFANLKISPQYPLKRIEYPAIVVNFSPGTIMNAGVGHSEVFDDPDGFTRIWGHRRFEGSIEFEMHALSPQDRDILADSLLEILAFGRLDDALIPFFYSVFRGSTDPNTDATLFNQLMLDTDRIEDGGNSASIAPWQPEDVLVYTTSYTCVLHGGFYNSLPTGDGLVGVSRVRLTGYADMGLPWEETFELQSRPDPTPQYMWTNPRAYIDEANNDNWPMGTSVISAGEELFLTGMIISGHSDVTAAVVKV